MRKFNQLIGTIFAALFLLAGSGQVFAQSAPPPDVSPCTAASI